MKKNSKITLRFLIKRCTLPYLGICHYKILMYATISVDRTPKGGDSRNFVIDLQRVLIDLLKVLQLVRDKTGI